MIRRLIYATGAVLIVTGTALFDWRAALIVAGALFILESLT